GLAGAWLSTIVRHWLIVEWPNMARSEAYVPETVVVVAAVVVMATIVCGLVPALQATTPDINAFKTTRGGVFAEGPAQGILSREWLAGLQLTLALALLIGTGLLVRSLTARLDSSLGFQA